MPALLAGRASDLHPVAPSARHRGRSQLPGHRAAEAGLAPAPQRHLRVLLFRHPRRRPSRALARVRLDDPEAELAPGLALLGAVDAKFVEVCDVLEPEDSGSSSRAFISRGYDATTHFESTVDDVLEMYTRITGKVLDLDAVDPDKASGGGDDE